MKKLFLVFLTLFLLISAFSITAFASSGSCGAKIKWVLYNDGVLVITGSGDMYDFTKTTNTEGFYGSSADAWLASATLVKSVRIDEGITSLGRNAFNGCTNLTEITLPSTITKIGSGAFANCKSITEINLHDGITSIGGSSFSGCTSLKNIEIPSSITTIPSYAFYGCTRLSSVRIPSSVTSMGEYAFYNCNNISSVYADSVESWCNIYFYDWTSNPLNDSDFYVNNTLVTSLEIPESVTKIPVSAFNSCTSLKTITIPEHLTQIGKGAFVSCTNLTEINWNAKNISNFTHSTTVFDNAGINGDGIVLKLGDSVETLPQYAFDAYSSSHYPNIKVIETGNSITPIQNTIFRSNPHIERVVFGNGTTTIEKYAFSNCEGIKYLEFGENIKSIGVDAFLNCKNVESIVWNATDADDLYSNQPFSNVGISGDGVSVIFGDKVTKIPNYIFTRSNSSYSAPKITNVTIGKGIKKIGAYSFNGCYNLENLYIKDLKAWCETEYTGSSSYHIMYYADNMYINNSPVSNLIIPEGTTKISRCAFYNCQSLVSISLPESLTHIEASAFENCTNLSSLEGGRGISLVFLKEPHINTDVYKEALQHQVPLIGSDEDILINAINSYLRRLRAKEIELAFEQAEKEVEDLHKRTAEGLVTAKLEGKQVGGIKGKKLNVKKAIAAKSKIRELSKDFDGTLNDIDLMAVVGVSRNTFYKYKREILIERAGLDD